MFELRLLPIWAATTLYAIQAIVSIRATPAQSLVLAGYIIANLGLMWSMAG